MGSNEPPRSGRGVYELDTGDQFWEGQSTVLGCPSIKARWSKTNRQSDEPISHCVEHARSRECSASYRQLKSLPAGPNDPRRLHRRYPVTRTRPTITKRFKYKALQIFVLALAKWELGATYKARCFV
jgi:hypothetical protein